MQHHVYLRLLEKEETSASEIERLEAVRKTVEKIGGVHWQEPPKMHGRGGMIALFFLPAEPDYDVIVAVIDADGFMLVI